MNGGRKVYESSDAHMGHRNRLNRNSQSHKNLPVCRVLDEGARNQILTCAAEFTAYATMWAQ